MGREKRALPFPFSANPPSPPSRSFSSSWLLLPLPPSPGTSLENLRGKGGGKKVRDSSEKKETALYFFKGNTFSKAVKLL